MPSDLKLSVQSVTPDVTLTLSDPYIGSAYSPQVGVSEIEGGHEVAITYKAPSGIATDTFDVLDGVDGTDGVDGVSPTVEIESTTDAHTITITDADGAHSYTVDTYADEEAARATAESSRVADESSRVTAEQARASAESSRTAAESARVTAEASRATAEQSRAAAESSRDEAEQARATAETARATAESARATAEQGRATAEQARAAAETARASAENERAIADSYRVLAEEQRVAAESARASAESARASAETSRAAAESARATAESARATEWTEIKAEAESTIQAAEDATDAAQSATSDATAAAAEARAASAATWLSGNVLFGELSEGVVLTADDVYAAPPKGVEVFGVSTQSGTPTPDAPVPIESVDALTLHVCGKNVFDPSHLLDASGWTVSNGVYTGYIANLTNVYGSRNHMYPISGLSGTPQSYTISLDYVPTDATKATYVGFVYTDGTVIYNTNAMGSAGRKSFTSDGSKSLAGLYFTYSSGQNVSFSNIQLEVGTTATAYEPYVGTSVSIPLSNNKCRSLPDGTRDTLTLSYIGPSTREGWGVFGKTLVQNVGHVADMGTLAWYAVSSDNAVYYADISDSVLGRVSLGVNTRCTMFTCQESATASNTADKHACIQYSNRRVMFRDNDHAGMTRAEVQSYVSSAKFDYPLETPVTTTLDPIELPILPNPLTAWADGGSAQPTLSMEYEQDINIVIGELRSAIADMATS